MTLMKTILLLSLLLLAGPAGLRGQSPQPADSLLRARLDTIVKHNLPRGAAAGICIYDLSAGRTLYEHQADKLSRPASTMKVMTAITALAQSGAMEPFRTELWTTGRVAGDTLRGDLYVVGSFDPEFDTDDLEELIGGLTRRGIRVVDGRIVGDVSMKDSLYWGSGWLWDDAPAPYQPYLSPLMLRRAGTGCVGHRQPLFLLLYDREPHAQPLARRGAAACGAQLDGERQPYHPARQRAGGGGALVQPLRLGPHVHARLCGAAAGGGHPLYGRHTAGRASRRPTASATCPARRRVRSWPHTRRPCRPCSTRCSRRVTT